MPLWEGVKKQNKKNVRGPAAGPRPAPAGMSAGCIPVVLRRGGVEDIVSHGVNGFLGPAPEDVEQLTLQVGWLVVMLVGHV